MDDAQHWPSERMIAEGHAEYATEDDLQPLDNEALLGIATLCEMKETAPDECIPCLALVIVHERQQALITPPEYTPPVLGEDAPFQPTEGPLTVLERIARKSQELSDLVTTVLSGPPVPPRDVSLEELAALVIGAEKWVQMLDAQGLELAPSQESVKQEIERVIAKVRS